MADLTRPASDAAYVPRPERVTFEESKLPQDFLRWLNAYTNEQRGDDELHALCSWAHAVINALSLEGAP